ncbi:hypothetical protein BH20ACT5_BH20ACT5_14070 [soil metagenome]
MDVVSVGLWRCPAAEPVQVDGRWWVARRGESELVLPRGVAPDLDFGNEAVRLAATLHEVHEELRLTATLTGQAAADHLAEHVRAFGGPDLCGHGLPMWHEDRPRQKGGSCRHAGVPGSTDAGVSVDAVQQMVTTLDAVRDAYERLARARQPLSRRVTADLLAWPVLPDWYRVLVSAELDRDGHLWTGRARTLVRLVLDAAMRDSGLRTAVVWRPQGRPELALVAASDTALYVADAVAHVGVLDEDRTLLCSVCGQPFTPKRAPREGDALYCRAPECQRTRARRNQARKRAHERGVH